MTIFSSEIVPGFIFKSTFPHTVSTLVVAPKTAYVYVMYLSLYISDPSFLKYGCGLTLTLIKTSPASPLSEKLPFLLILKLTPLSIPFGIVTFSLHY
jgi:hypothetical protein